MDPIKEAFMKIKRDITSIFSEIEFLKREIKSLRTVSTNSQENQTQTNFPTDKQTDSPENPNLQALYPQNFRISTGNGGVPTDKQTDRQTNRQTQDSKKDPISEFKRIQEILSSLDESKQNIRKTFKSLTNQEMRVFSTIYDLEDAGQEEITYKLLSESLNLSESSIRDYVNKIIQKGVEIGKIKQNNKQILLKIPPTLRKIASLQTIIKLRDL